MLVMHPLRDRRFRALVIGQAVNGIGSWCALVAIWGYAAQRFNAEPWQVAVLGLTWTIPGALLGPLAGVPTDRLDPRRVLIAADSAAALCAVAMAFSDTYWMLVIWSSAQGFAKSFAQPAFGALAPRIVEDDQLARANALLATAMQVSIAFGPLLGATAIQTMGAKGAFLADAITYAIGIMVVIPLVISPRPPRTQARQSAWIESREGWRIVRERPEVMRLFVGAIGIYMLWGSGVTMEPLYVKDVLHRSPATFAHLQTAFGIAMVLFGFVVAHFGERSTRVHIVALGAIGSGLSAALYLGTAQLSFAFIGITLWGVCTPWFTTPMRTLLQRATPIETHGRVFAVDETLRSWSMALATGTAALAFGGLGHRNAGLLYGAVPVAGGLVVLSTVRRLRTVVDVSSAKTITAVAALPAATPIGE